MNKVKLVAITKPIVEGINTPEEFIAYAARVSNPSNQLNTMTSPKLLKYLVDHKHFSPFEMVHATLEINTSRDIGRQILRHRSFSFQEFSGRYADMGELGFQTRETRLQDTKNRQNSISLDGKDHKGIILDKLWHDYQEDIIIKSKEIYNWALNNGIAKEQARAVLPEGLTNSRLYMSGSIRSWIHYTQLRMENGTQKEHMEIATLCYNELKIHFPNVFG